MYFFSRFCLDFAKIAVTIVETYFLPFLFCLKAQKHDRTFVCYLPRNCNTFIVSLTRRGTPPTTRLEAGGRASPVNSNSPLWGGLGTPCQSTSLWKPMSCGRHSSRTTTTKRKKNHGHIFVKMKKYRALYCKTNELCTKKIFNSYMISQVDVLKNNYIAHLSDENKLHVLCIASIYSFFLQLSGIYHWTRHVRLE